MESNRERLRKKLRDKKLQRTRGGGARVDEPTTEPSDTLDLLKMVVNDAPDIAALKKVFNKVTQSKKNHITRDFAQKCKAIKKIMDSVEAIERKGNEDGEEGEEYKAASTAAQKNDGLAVQEEEHKEISGPDEEGGGEEETDGEGKQEARGDLPPPPSLREESSRHSSDEFVIIDDEEGLPPFLCKSTS